MLLMTHFWPSHTISKDIQKLDAEHSFYKTTKIN